ASGTRCCRSPASCRRCRTRWTRLLLVAHSVRSRTEPAERGQPVKASRSASSSCHRPPARQRLCRVSQSPCAVRLRAVLETLDAAAVRRWCAAGLAALRRHEKEINDLNVYPVPDGDTGTNLVLTFAAAQRALQETPPEQVGTHVGSALHVMARGAATGARGNSGLILAELLRGLADTLAAAPVARGRYLADGLTAAAKEGYAAVAEP